MVSGDSKPRYYSREQWLQALALALEPMFAQAKAKLPRHKVKAHHITAEGFAIRFTCGFPSNRKKFSGECWSSQASRDGHYEIFVTPKLDDALQVAGVIVHELIHAAVGTDAKHGPKFARVALALGLEGKMTATTTGAALAAQLRAITDRLGPYPHASLRELDPDKKKQTTRLIKCECPECGYTARVTRKWLDVAPLHCPNDEAHAVERDYYLVADQPTEEGEDND